MKKINKRLFKVEQITVLKDVEYVSAYTEEEAKEIAERIDFRGNEEVVSCEIEVSTNFEKIPTGYFYLSENGTLEYLESGKSFRNNENQ